MKHLSIFCLLFSFGVINSQSPALDWVKQLGGNSGESARRLAIDGLSNVYVVGEFSGSMDADPGPGVYSLTASGNDVFVVKLNSSGDLVWAKSFGGSSYEIVNSLILDDSGNVLVGGEFASNDADFDPGAGSYTMSAANNDGYIVKLSGAGNFMWAVQLKAYYMSHIEDLATDSAGTVFATGFIRDTADFDPGPGQKIIACPQNAPDMFIWKLHSNGSLDTVFHMYSPGFEISRNIDVDMAGNIFISGDWRDTANFSTGPLSYTLASKGNSDAFMARYTAAGQLAWVRQVGGSSYANAYSQVIDSISNVFILGGFFGSVDVDPGPGTKTFAGSGMLGMNEIFVLKLDAAGNYQWASQLGDPDMNDYSESITLDQQGNVYTAGYFEGLSTPDMDPGPGTYTLGNSDADQNLFVVKLKSDGSFGWAFMIGNEGHNYGYDVAHQGSHLFVSGFFNDSTVDFDPSAGTFTLSSTYNDAFVMKLATECSLTGSLALTGSSLTAYPAGAGYQWYDCSLDDEVYGENSQVFVPPANGNYAVIVSVSGCKDTSDCVQFVKTSLAELANVDLFEIYPNPAKGMITLSLQGHETRGNPDLCVYASNGLLVYNRKITENETSVDLRDLSAGIYHCTLTLLSGESYSKRLCIIK